MSSKLSDVLESHPMIVDFFQVLRHSQSEDGQNPGVGQGAVGI